MSELSIPTMSIATESIATEESIVILTTQAELSFTVARSFQSTTNELRERQAPQQLIDELEAASSEYGNAAQALFAVAATNDAAAWEHATSDIAAAMQLCAEAFENATAWRNEQTPGERV
jgi:hypothetical protein